MPNYQKIGSDKIMGMNGAVSAELIEESQAQVLVNYAQKEAGKIETRNGNAIAATTTNVPNPSTNIVPPTQTTGGSTQNLEVLSTGLSLFDCDGLVCLGEYSCDKDLSHTTMSGQQEVFNRFFVYIARQANTRPTAVGEEPMVLKVYLAPVTGSLQEEIYELGTLTQGSAVPQLRKDTNNPANIGNIRVRGVVKQQQHIGLQFGGSNGTPFSIYNGGISSNMNLDIPVTAQSNDFGPRGEINHYKQSTQYNSMLIISDRVNGDLVLSRLPSLDPSTGEPGRELLVGVPLSQPRVDLALSLSHNRRNRFNTTDLVITYPSPTSQPIHTPMALLRFKGKKKQYQKSDLSDQVQSQRLSPTDITKETPINVISRSGCPLFFLWDTVSNSDYKNPYDESKTIFTYNHTFINQNGFNISLSNTNENGEFEDVLGELVLEELEAKIQRTENGQIIEESYKYIAADPYIWDDMIIPYRPTGGINPQAFPQANSNLLTRKDRQWNIKQIGSKTKPLISGSSHPEGYISSWNYRFVWEYHDGSFSIPSEPVPAYDTMWVGDEGDGAYLNILNQSYRLNPAMVGASSAGTYPIVTQPISDVPVGSTRDYVYGKRKDMFAIGGHCYFYQYLPTQNAPIPIASSTPGVAASAQKLTYDKIINKLYHTAQNTSANDPNMHPLFDRTSPPSTLHQITPIAVVYNSGETLLSSTPVCCVLEMHSDGAATSIAGSLSGQKGIYAVNVKYLPMRVHLSDIFIDSVYGKVRPYIAPSIYDRQAPFNNILLPVFNSSDATLVYSIDSRPNFSVTIPTNVIHKYIYVKDPADKSENYDNVLFQSWRDTQPFSLDNPVSALYWSREEATKLSNMKFDNDVPNDVVERILISGIGELSLTNDLNTIGVTANNAVGTGRTNSSNVWNSPHFELSSETITKSAAKTTGNFYGKSARYEYTSAFSYQSRANDPNFSIQFFSQDPNIALVIDSNGVTSLNGAATAVRYILYIQFELNGTTLYIDMGNLGAGLLTTTPSTYYQDSFDGVSDVFFTGGVFSFPVNIPLALNDIIDSFKVVFEVEPFRVNWPDPVRDEYIELYPKTFFTEREWNINSPAGVANPQQFDFYAYLQSERLTIPEQLSTPIPASVLFDAPMTDISMPASTIPLNAKKLHIYRTKSSISPDWNPQDYGLIKTIDIPLTSAFGIRNIQMPSSGISFKDNVKDTQIDFQDNPLRYDALTNPLKSRFNVAINERVYYANFKMKEQALPVFCNSIILSLPTSSSAPSNTSMDFYYMFAYEDSAYTLGSVLRSHTGEAARNAIVFASALGVSVPIQATGDDGIIISGIPNFPDLSIKKVQIFRLAVPAGSTAQVPPTPQEVFYPGTNQVNLASMQTIANGLNNSFVHVGEYKLEESEGIFFDSGAFSNTAQMITAKQAGNLVGTNIEENYESSIMYSEPFEPGWIKLQNLIAARFGDGDQITGMCALYGNLIVFKENSIHRFTLQGDEAPVSRTDEIASNLGCIAPNSIVVVDNIVYFLSWNGFMAYDNNTFKRIDEGAKNDFDVLLAHPAFKNILRFSTAGYNQQTGEVVLNLPNIGTTINTGWVETPPQTGQPI